MRKAAFIFAIATTIGFAAQSVTPPAANAGVPRSCVHPRADSLDCARDTRRVSQRVLSSARLRALARQHYRYEHVAPHEDRERNRMLQELRDAPLCPRC